MQSETKALKLLSESQQKSEAIGEAIGRMLKPSMIFCLVGDLGAGKTTLTRGIGRGWGSDIKVTSPTFKLVNQYTRSEDKSLLYHLDCYRLQSSDDGETIGLGDILAEGEPIIIEWPDVIDDWLPKEKLRVEITALDFEKRAIHFIATGALHASVIDQLAAEFSEELL